MAKQYLLEIGLEEVPARFLLSLSEQLKERLATFLTEERISFSHINSYATPRRLAVIVENIAEKQADLNERVKGPSIKVAKDDTGAWSKAAQGFTRGQKATLDDLVIEGDYVYIDKFVAGASVESVLTNVDSVLKNMTFPVAMHWSNVPTPFIRPIHWMVSLLDTQVIPFEFVGVKASNVTKGHRFLGHDVTINQPSDYLASLKEQFVLADFDERRTLIREQVEAIADANSWDVPIDDALLEEVTAIVEWPTAFYGEFEEEYLAVPESVLITAMKDHQRYFYAISKETGRLLPVFISVRNGNAEHIENVIKGNRKVLKARLEDALFFYQEDLSHDLTYYLEKLSTVNEHVKIGSFAQKQARVKKGIEILGEILESSNISSETIATSARAALIYKFDLLTQTVGEFDELQGQLGKIYATYFGESEAVAAAIGSQYLPVTSGGKLPDTTAGAMLALIDKLDTLANYFSIELIPTGSNDPYALRRKALGIVEIILDQAWNFDIIELLNKVSVENQSEDWIIFKDKLVNFIKGRVQQHLETDQIDHDIIQAVSKVSHLNVYYIVESAHQLQSLKNTQASDYRSMVEAMTRVVNLGSKVKEMTEVNLNLAETVSETNLLKQLQTLTATSPKEILAQFSSLVEKINDYFEHNMVNAEDEQLKKNRQATMKCLTQFIMQMVDPRELISKFD